MWDPSGGQPPRNLSVVIDDCALHSLLIKEAADALRAADETRTAALDLVQHLQTQGGRLESELRAAIFVFAQARAAAKSSLQPPKPAL